MVLDNDTVAVTRRCMVVVMIVVSIVLRLFTILAVDITVNDYYSCCPPQQSIVVVSSSIFQTRHNVGKVVNGQQVLRTMS